MHCHKCKNEKLIEHTEDEAARIVFPDIRLKSNLIICGNGYWGPVSAWNLEHEKCDDCPDFKITT